PISPAGHRALVGLVKLIARDGMIEKNCEIRKKIELIVDQIRDGLSDGRVTFARPFAGQTVSMRFATVARVDRAEAPERTVLDGALRYLIGRAPLAAVEHSGDRHAVVGAAFAVTQHAIPLLIVL